METITKHIGEGFGKGELYAALAYDSTDKFGGKAVKQIRFNPASGADGIQIGDSTTAHTLSAYTVKAASIYTTCAHTSGYVVPVLIDSTITGVGGEGCALKTVLNVSNVAAGSCINAFYAYLDFKTSGSSAGLASAICAEMVLNATSGKPGAYTVLELELGCPASWAGVNYVSFIRATSWGDTKANFDTYGYLLILTGLTPGSGKLLYNNTLRCLIDTTAWYLPLSSAEGSFTTAYPIASSSTTGFRSTATFVPDQNRTNYAFAVGTIQTALNFSMIAATTKNFSPVQMNINVIGTAPTTSTINLMQSQLTHSTVDMPNLRLKCTDFTVAVAKNVKDVYAYQGEIDLTGTVAIAGEACVLGLVLNIPSGTVTGRVQGQVIAITGPSVPATTSYGFFMHTGNGATLTNAIYIETESGTTITTGIRMGNAGTFTNLITAGAGIVNFLNLDGAGNAGFVTTGDKGATASHTLKIIVPGGEAGYIKVYPAT